MKHRELDQSVRIYQGIYSSTIYEMEFWLLSNAPYTIEEYKQQLKERVVMDCRLERDCVGLYRSKKEALESLDMIYDDCTFDDDQDLHLVLIRERALCCMMQPEYYLKEWTYIQGILHDESIVRNYDVKNNPFFGRPKEMIHFKRGDIVMIADGLRGHWGIICDTPFCSENIDGKNSTDNQEKQSKEEMVIQKDYSDDSYIIITDGEGNHEHILSHHILPAFDVPEFVRTTLEAGLLASEQ